MIRKRKTIQITLTEMCNLSCSYCYEKNRDCNILDFSLIKEALYNIFNENDSFDEIEIDFHGGEVFLVFEYLKEICEWLWSQQWPKPYICFVTTLVHGKIQRWLANNKHRLVLGLSLDGTPEMHNINRCNSYELIDIDFFVKTWPLQPVKSTISPASVNNLTESIIYLHGLGFSVNCNLAYGVDWYDDVESQYARQLRLLSDYYIANPTIYPCSLLIKSLWTILSSSPKKWCGCGDAMRCLGVDGGLYPCQMFLPSAQHGDLPAYGELLTILQSDFSNQECRQCGLYAVCGTCYGMNYSHTGSIAQKNPFFCRIRKIETYASAYMQGMMLGENKDYSLFANYTPSKLKVLAQAITKIQMSTH